MAAGQPPEVRVEAAGPLAPGSSAPLDLREAAPWSEKSGQEPPTLALGSRGSILQLMLHSHGAHLVVPSLPLAPAAGRADELF